MDAAESKQVAETILAQMGGARRLAVMCGCKDFTVSGPGTLNFRVGKNEKKVTCCQIALEADDTYTVRFYAGRSFRTLRQVYECSDIYADQLRPIFEAQTGMYLSL